MIECGSTKPSFRSNSSSSVVKCFLFLSGTIYAGVHPWNGGDGGEYLGDLSLGGDDKGDTSQTGRSCCWDVDGLGDCCVPFDRFCRFAGVLTTGPAIPNLTLEVWGVFFPVWIFACSPSLSFWSHFSSQKWHLNGFSQVCSLSCTYRSSFCTSQKSCHSGGTWMVLLECESFHALLGHPLSRKFLSQWSQLNGLSCTLRLSFRMSFLLQLNCNKEGINQMTSLLNLTQLFRLNEWFKW